jgi:2,3-bisphosphoglycerate-independent phosphoglycerate mutase
MDGKDSSLRGGGDILFRLQDYMSSAGVGKIASLIGRDYAMDRNKNWDRTQITYDLLVSGIGQKTDDPIIKMKEYYSQGYSDSNIPPTIIDQSGTIKDSDAVVFFNFREDSMRQIISPFIDDKFDLFNHSDHGVLYIGAMTQYFNMPRLKALFPNEPVKNCLAEVLSNSNKTHLHVSETEKYLHTTYFFNGLTDQPFPGESDILIDSVKNPKDNPQMKAEEITDKVIKELQDDKFDFMVINYANADTLAHTGDLEKTIKGAEVIDKHLGRLYKAIVEKEGTLVITSDHGHAEHMVSKQAGDVVTGHAVNPVLLYLVSKDHERKRLDYEIDYSVSQPRGILADVAPTILDLMQIEKPSNMTGGSLMNVLVLKKPN